jgi:hypothetical protein
VTGVFVLFNIKYPLRSCSNLLYSVAALFI